MTNVNYSTNSFDDSGVRLGADYKYHLNIRNGIFVAGGLFYDDLNLEDTNTNPTPLGNVSTTNNVDRIYGASLDLGYDYSKEFTSFVGVTFNKINSSLLLSFRGIRTTVNVADTGMGLTVGGKYNFSNEYSVILSYNRSEFNALGVNLALQMLKLGISYNF